MPNKSDEDYRKFNEVLQKLKSEGKISDAPPPSDQAERRKYIEKLTQLFKKEVYGSV
jgi:hypothetical protein|tara:strand:+ start:1388 stop:1558 length:171 start_codon:yes stop_codon:yes gene_type:complete